MRRQKRENKKKLNKFKEETIERMRYKQQRM